MGTAKRQRNNQPKNARVKAAQTSAEKAQKKRQMFGIIALIGIFGMFASLLGTVALTGREDASSTTQGVDDDGTDAGDAGDADNGAQPVVGNPDSSTDCPPESGSAERVTEFSDAPPLCIDLDANYRAVMTTSIGEIVIDLDAQAAPSAVNNFVTLSRYQFYDGILFHRIVANFVAQAGDPVGEPWGTHGPGYTIAEEPPLDGDGDGRFYARYDIAMAKTAAPNSTGSQFFIVTGDTAALDQLPTYSLFGRVAEESHAIVDELGRVATTNDFPDEPVVIESVEIEQG